jgi:hypothetical protein
MFIPSRHLAQVQVLKSMNVQLGLWSLNKYTHSIVWSLSAFKGSSFVKVPTSERQIHFL